MINTKFTKTTDPLDEHDVIRSSKNRQHGYFRFLGLNFVTMRLFISVLFLSAFANWAALKAQYVQIGEGNFGLGTPGGPFQVSTSLPNYTSRFAHIFPAMVLGNLSHGDTITSLEFMRTAGGTLHSNCNLKIYLKNTAASDFGTSLLRWSTEISGTTLAYNQSPASDIGPGEGFHSLLFSNAVFVYDTTKGQNLQLMIEYRQTAVQSQTVLWYFENSASVPGYSSNQTKSANNTFPSDSLGSGTEYHPTIIFNYPRLERDFAVLKVYTLGKLPVPLGNPDDVQALIRNVGKKQQSDIRLKTWIQGDNTGEDSVTASLNPYENAFIKIPGLAPSKRGLDTVHVTVTNDANTANNDAVSYRLCNENIYSYRDVTLSPAPGGIGFNGQTGDFVARFYSNKSKAINQISVQFFLTGRPFRIGIWDNSGGGNKPGKLIYLSDSLVTKSGTYILDLKKPLVVNGPFYVGVRQLGTNNVAFGYQMELPVRPKTFFYTSPAGDTNWFDFHPDAPYKFLIEPRLQGDTDLAALSADFPWDTIDRHTTDTIAPRATIGNIGVTDLTDSFDVTCEITFYGKVVYREKWRDTLSSGQKRSYTFPKKFYPLDFGEHKLSIIVHQKNDQIHDNDTAFRLFYVGVKKDVMVSTVFDPPNNATLECFADSVLPVATIQNPGYDNSVSFIARCRIFKGNTVVYNQIQTLSLLKFNSRILQWPVYKCNDTGKFRAVFTTEMNGDVYRKNDTIVRYFTVVKSYDAGIDSIFLPAAGKVYQTKKSYKPLVRFFNDGILDLTAATAYCRITSAYSSKVYHDTIAVSVDAKNVFLSQFNRNFIPDKKGLYQIVVTISYPADLFKSNDSLKQTFHVGFPSDYMAKTVLYPLITDTLAVGNGPFAPRIRFANEGYIKNVDLAPVVCQIWKGNTRVYQDIKSISLDTGKTFDLDFATTFSPMAAGEYTILAYSNYVGEWNRPNDSISGKFMVTIGKDATVTAVISPLSNIEFSAREDTVQMACTVANFGRLNMNAVRVYAEIFYKGNSVYFQKIDDTVKALSSANYYFQTDYIPQDSGNYSVFYYVYSSDDQNIFNDTLVARFRAYRRQDVSAVRWLQPVSGGSMIQNEGVLRPELEITYMNRDTTQMASGKLKFEIREQPSGNSVYYDSGAFTSLKTDSSRLIVAWNPWKATVVAQYLAVGYLDALDLFPENDTVKATFEVRVNGIQDHKSGDINVYPNPTGRFLQIVSPHIIRSVVLTDVSGKSVYHTIVNSMIDMGHLASGTYVLMVSTNTGRQAFNIVKE